MVNFWNFLDFSCQIWSTHPCLASCSVLLLEIGWGHIQHGGLVNSRLPLGKTNQQMLQPCSSIAICGEFKKPIFIHFWPNHWPRCFEKRKNTSTSRKFRFLVTSASVKCEVTNSKKKRVELPRSKLHQLQIILNHSTLTTVKSLVYKPPITLILDSTTWAPAGSPYSHEWHAIDQGPACHHPERKMMCKDTTNGRHLLHLEASCWLFPHLWK